MEIQLKNYTYWELKRAVFLLGEAEKMGIDVSLEGMLSFDNTGRLRLWLEYYQLSLYLYNDGNMVKTDIFVQVEDSMNGDFFEFPLNKNTMVKHLERLEARFNNRYLKIYV
jgi:hypothetical protein